ncbi:cytochrome c oxidase subunit II [Candidatus Halobonum tyrrellensis]|uniref:cytochrome-c oxidase n=1 Tax=Candidatus Halobonum tyrrellensis G22 TaxID=1324957 RepID=V4HEH2_9EURY|nr:cytochrome c oxidase subunit II [Candidatus Halobonum tyrrellensis]ESP88483.1 cytochrome c oxidase subunit II [Candidatus Halobonum tyrrellensis G22]
MTAKRLGTFFAAVVGLTAFVGTAAAQPSTTAGLINGLNGKLLYIAVPITILVEVILIYTVLKFKDSDEAKPTRENRRLEITWTIATAIILVFVGVASYGALANPNVTYTSAMAQPDPGQGDVEVTATAYQWNWRMNYTNEGVTGLTASDLNLSTVDELPTSETEDVSGPTLVLPRGQDVYITTTSEDVIHAFHVPELGLKQDSMPNQNNTIKTRPLEVGVYQGYCAEYCGSGHSQMYFNVVVVEQDTYDRLMSEAAAASSESASTNATSANATSTPSGSVVGA